MKSGILFVLLLFYLNMNAQVLFDSQSNANPSNWYIVDDVVMGGRSKGQFEITEEGHTKFYGKVSLENNGGFSSIRYGIPKTQVKPEQSIKVLLKGDGNRYQFRVKNQRNQYYGYIATFETNGNWQTCEFQLKNLYPTFRGRRLDLPNFSHNSLEEITFLIGNKKSQEFELVISKIDLLD